MQHTATHCNTLQHRAILAIDCRRMSAIESDVAHLHATHSNTQQHTATHTVTHTATLCNTGLCRIDCRPPVRSHVNHLCNTPQHAATHRNTPPHTTTHCNTLQHTATHCNTLQHRANFAIDCRCMSVSESDVAHLHATHCTILQHTATHRNTPQHMADFQHMALIVGRMSAVM